ARGGLRTVERRRAAGHGRSDGADGGGDAPPAHHGDPAPGHRSARGAGNPPVAPVQPAALRGARADRRPPPHGGGTRALMRPSEPVILLVDDDINDRALL